MVRQRMRMSSVRVVLVATVAVAASGAGAASNDAGVATVTAAEQHPLMAVERNRASIVQRIVGDWSDALSGLPAERRITKEQLSEALWQMRSDRLLAASLLGSYSAIEALVEESRSETRGATRVATKNLGDANADLAYTPVNPCRIIDTRVAGGALSANLQRTFDGYNASSFAFQGGTATGCGMPSGTAAIAMNVYAVNPTNLGFIKLWPANGAEPAVSTVNYQTGIVAIATGAIVPVDGANSNRFIAKSPAGVDLVADVVGYFRAPGLGNVFVQGGNTFGAAANIGVKDNFPVEVIANNSRVFRYEPHFASPNVIGGGPSNSANVNGATAGQTIAGGGQVGANCDDPPTQGTRPCGNRTGAQFGTIGGGYANYVADQGGVIGGGYSNTSGYLAYVGGGQSNIANGQESVIGGGGTNRADAAFGVVGGGNQNSVTGPYYSTIGGGWLNAASGAVSTISGGQQNTASGAHSIVAGGLHNAASGQYAMAAGYNANANAAGCFVWSDSSSSNATSCLGTNQFLVRALGGTYIFSGGNADINYSGVKLNAGAGAWSVYSDRAGKESVAGIDSIAVLNKLVSMPISTWNWRAQDPGIRHMGPMAQDFHAAFGLGESDAMISTVDSEGVALAAIQGLHRVIQQKDARIEALEHAVGELQRTVDALVSSTMR